MAQIPAVPGLAPGVSQQSIPPQGLIPPAQPKAIATGPAPRPLRDPLKEPVEGDVELLGSLVASVGDRGLEGSNLVEADV